MTFWAEIYESFRRVAGPASTLIGIAFSVAAYFLIPTAEVPIKHLVVPSILVFLIVWVLFDLACRLFKRAKSPISKVLRALPPPASELGKNAILLLEPSQIYGQQSVVSVFEIQDEFEIFIGVGVVHTIQEDGRIQILAGTADQGAHEKSWQEILKNDSKALQRLRIKPSIPSNLLRTQDV